MIPKQAELEEPMLRVLAAHGGQARPDEVYEGVRRLFPQLTDADLLETVPSGDNKFKNRIRFVRQALIDRGEMYSPNYGTWGITTKGMERITAAKSAQFPVSQSKPTPNAHPVSPVIIQSSLAATSAVPVAPQISSTNLEELFDDYFAAFERKVIQALLDLSPAQFERFAAELITAYGFMKTRVTNTNTAPDGGIDGYGELKVGLASVKAAFQCKRWKAQVGRPEIDKFRGAIQGQFEHGYFFTTASFSDEARKASVKDGAVPIFLFDGHEIAQIMIEKQLGITRRPIEIYEDRIGSLF
jgi:restriction system protein